MLRAPTALESVQHVILSDINPSKFLSLRIDPEETQNFPELVESIKKHGLLQPLVLRTCQSELTGRRERYELVCGHRRYAACRKLSIERVPSIVKDLSDREALEIALIENLQRQDLDPIEEAEAFKLYVLNFGRGSITALSQKIGKSQEYVSHRLLLLGLPKILLERISRHLLKAAEATELVWLKDPSKQIELANEIAEKKLSFRDTRLAVKMMRKEPVSAKVAVERVLQGTSRKEEPWSPYPSQSSEERDELAVLNRAVLLLRSSLTGLDLLIDQTACQELRNVLKGERTSVHSALDDLIKQKVQYKRKQHVCKALA